MQLIQKEVRHFDMVIFLWFLSWSFMDLIYYPTPGNHHSCGRRTTSR
jgi:hypothetical protein